MARIESMAPPDDDLGSASGEKPLVWGGSSVVAVPSELGGEPGGLASGWVIVLGSEGAKDGCGP